MKAKDHTGFCAGHKGFKRKEVPEAPKPKRRRAEQRSQRVVQRAVHASAERWLRDTLRQFWHDTPLHPDNLLCVLLVSLLWLAARH